MGGTSVDRWLEAAEADVEARRLPAVKPLLQGLAGALRVLRAADWNDRADVASPPSTPPADDPGPTR